MIRIQWEGVPVVDSQAYEHLADACFTSQGLTVPLFATLTMTNEARIRDINRQWRDKDTPTDVLSFPALDLTPDDTLRDGHPQLAFSWDSGENAYFLGDVILCVPRALAQSAEYGHSLEEELLYLFAHGLLHLMGYDHMQEEDKKSMRDKEKEALSRAKDRVFPDQDLLDLARGARANAYVPYSNFRVGAALLCEDGQVFLGSNIENISYGLTMCAERTAVFKAVSQGCRHFKAIAIAADATAPWPCGACRQVLAEFSPKMRVMVTWDQGQTAQSTLEDLLPNSFLDFKEDQSIADKT